MPYQVSISGNNNLYPTAKALFVYRSVPLIALSIDYQLLLIVLGLFVLSK